MSSPLDVAKPSPVVSLKASALKVQIPSGIEGDGFTGNWKVNLLRKVGTNFGSFTPVDAAQSSKETRSWSSAPLPRFGRKKSSVFKR